MAYVHIAHDCQVGNHTIFANNAQLAGHVTSATGSILGGATAVHQFVRIGAHAFTGLGSVICAGRAAVRHGRRQHRRSPTASTARASSGAASRRSDRRVKRAYRMLYRNGLSLDEAQGELEAQARGVPRRSSRLLDFLAHQQARHRPLDGPSLLRVAHGGRRSVRRPARRARCIARAQGTPPPDASFAGIGGPRMVAAGLRVAPSRWRSSRCAATPRCCAATARSWASAGASPGDCCASGPTCSSASIAPDFNLGLERALKDAGIPTVHYVSPSVWAWRARAHHEIARAVNRILVHVPVRAADLRSRPASRPATSAIRLPTLIPLEPEEATRRAAALRLPHGQADRGAAAWQPALGDALHGAAPSCRQPHRLRQEIRDVHFVLSDGDPGDARPVRACAARAPAHRPAAHAPLRPLARGARRGRPGAGRERHRDAGGGAVQDARW